MSCSRSISEYFTYEFKGIFKARTEQIFTQRLKFLLLQIHFHFVLNAEFMLFMMECKWCFNVGKSSVNFNDILNKKRNYYSYAEILIALRFHTSQLTRNSLTRVSLIEKFDNFMGSQNVVYNIRKFFAILSWFHWNLSASVSQINELTAKAAAPHQLLFSLLFNAAVLSESASECL